MDVAIVTYEKLPQLVEEERAVLPALERVGLRATVAVWSDPSVDWSRFRLAIVRDTWDYHLRRDEFLRWVERVSRVTELQNPAAALRWNAHKGYLRELQARGIPVTPTEWISAGSPVDVFEILRRRGWTEVVIKPAVSAGALDTVRFAADRVDDAQRFAAELASRGDVMVQPYLADLGRSGELSFLFFNNTYSHAVRRPPGMKGERSTLSAPAAHEATEAQLALASRVISASGFDLLYARVDCAFDSGGSLLVQELEVIEPQLFFGAHPGAADRFAQAVARRIRGGSHDG